MIESLRKFAPTILAASIVLTGQRASAANVFSTSFDGYSNVNALSAQNSWETNDVYVSASSSGQTDVVGLIGGYSQTVNDYWALLGGLNGNNPQLASILVYRPFSSEGLLTGGLTDSTLRFEVDFSVSSSVTPRPAEDAFGWSFRDSTGTQLFRLAFEPQAGASLRLKYYDGANTGTTTAFSLPYDSIFGLTVDVSMGNATQDTLSVSLTDGFNVTSQVLSGLSLPNGIAGNIAQIAARWDITNAIGGPQTGYGLNSMIFNDYSVSAVPEPGTAGALLIGATAFGLRRRRSVR